MRILIIEDEHKIASSLKRGLEQEAYSVDVAYTGTDGYDLASAEEFDLILLDIMLPGMDGIEICKRLREDKVHTPILMLTAKGETRDKITGLNTGADDYLAKPFPFEELLARIRALLRRPTNIIPFMLECDNLILDTVGFKVTRGKKQILLSKKEFALLEYLMRNKNIVLSKDKILEHVWSYDSDVLPNTVEQYIRYLRNKIDTPFSSSPTLVKTIRGFGYALQDPDV